MFGFVDLRQNHPFARKPRLCSMPCNASVPRLWCAFVLRLSSARTRMCIKSSLLSMLMGTRLQQFLHKCMVKLWSKFNTKNEAYSTCPVHCQSAVQWKLTIWTGRIETASNPGSNFFIGTVQPVQRFRLVDYRGRTDPSWSGSKPSQFIQSTWDQSSGPPGIGPRTKRNRFG